MGGPAWRSDRPKRQRLGQSKNERFKREHLFLHPLCAECERQGRVRLAVELDHIVPLHQNGPDWDVDPSNAQGLCVPCHREKTVRERGGVPKLGADADGWPLDPNHPWRRPKEP